MRILTCLTPIKLKSGSARKTRSTVSRRPSAAPNRSAVDADGIFRFSLLNFNIFGVVSVTIRCLPELVLKPD